MVFHFVGNKVPKTGISDSGSEEKATCQVCQLANWYYHLSRRNAIMI